MQVSVFYTHTYMYIDLLPNVISLQVVFNAHVVTIRRVVTTRHKANF